MLGWDLLRYRYPASVKFVDNKFHSSPSYFLGGGGRSGGAGASGLFFY